MEEHKIPELKLDQSPMVSSPVIASQQITQANDNENDNKSSNVWISRCGRVVDSRLLQYISSLSVTIFVLFFCIYQIISNEDDSSVYLTIISTILGIYLPSPLSSSNRNN